MAWISPAWITPDQLLVALSSLLLPQVIFALRVRAGQRGQHQHVGDLRLPGGWWHLCLRWLRLLLRSHRLLLRLLELVQGAQEVHLLPLYPRLDRLGTALQQVQSLAWLFCWQ